MGVDYQGLRFLLSSRSRGVQFDRTVMFGRQNFYALPQSEASKLLKRYGFYQQDASTLMQDFYIEPLLRLLGAEEIVSIDATAYEDASLIHDMNAPISDDLKNRFSVAFDGGTLEHVFNFPQALKNAMEMVREGGHLLQATICNGWAGHGFYQFSPELFFRAMSEENGYEIVNMFICESSDGAQWYRCSDPKVINRRVEFLTSRKTYLLVEARRNKVKEIFATPPMQSDYQPLWAKKNPHVPKPHPQTWRALIPPSVKGAVRSLKATARFGSLPGLRLRDSDAFPRYED